MKAMLDPRIVATSTQVPTFLTTGKVLVVERMTSSSQGGLTKLAIFIHPSYDYLVFAEPCMISS